MPALQVREFPDELYEELRAYAARNHRSIAQQTVACVEREIRRSRAIEAETSLAMPDDASDNIPIPVNVHEATMRARVVNPFTWHEALGIESEEVREARRAKRKELMRQIEEFHEKWKLPEQSPEELAQMIREERERRTDDIFANIERCAASRKED